ncbi:MULTISPECIES: element excision factor XisH family protein [Aerosakkonema]
MISAISDFHTANGQFLNYRIMLEVKEPDRHRAKNPPCFSRGSVKNQ